MLVVIEGDLTKDLKRHGDWCILQQNNCLSIRGHGLSDILAKKFPWCDIYPKRKQLRRANLATEETRAIPGTIDICKHPSGTIDSEKPVIVCMFAQYDMGKVGAVWTKNRPQWKEGDTSENREAWFAMCLTQVGHCIDEMTSKNPSLPRQIAVPLQIGCALAGGDHLKYRKMLEDFAQEFDIRVNAYRI